MSKSVLHSSPTRQYTLRESLQHDLERLLVSKEDCDVAFKLDGCQQLIRAHSCIIAVRCKSLTPQVVDFLTQKQSHPQEADAILEIPIFAVSLQAFNKVLKYIYTGIITLDSEDVFDVCTLSTFLQVAGLQNIVFAHLRNTENIHLMVTVLDRAVQNPDGNQLLIARLTEYFAQDCERILRCTPISSVSRDLMMHIVKQEDLWASELDLWHALVVWCSAQCGVKLGKKVSSMTKGERAEVAKHMQDFCRPGYVRILNFEMTAFSSEVEPLGVFSQEEILLKYRFDAAAGLTPFDHAFPLDRYNFLTRIRQRTMSFESSTHPHPRGVSKFFKVEMPIWTSLTKVTFDSRTSLGRYADLEFFADKDRVHRIFSLRGSSQSYSMSTSAMKNQELSRVPLEPLFIDGCVFWFSFYAPQNVGNLGWGYRFSVSIVR